MACCASAWSMVKQIFAAQEKFPLDDEKYPILLDENELGGCCVCMEYRTDAVLHPCRHACLCMICAKKMLSSEGATCPFCNRIVERVESIILVN
jgi:hypothetical protein